MLAGGDNFRPRSINECICSNPQNAETAFKIVADMNKKGERFGDETLSYECAAKGNGLGFSDETCTIFKIFPTNYNQTAEQDPKGHKILKLTRMTDLNFDNLFKRGKKVFSDSYAIQKCSLAGGKCETVMPEEKSICVDKLKSYGNPLSDISLNVLVEILTRDAEDVYSQLCQK